MGEPFSEVLREEAERSDIVQWGVTLSSAGHPPFGVLVATSDDAGRFFSGNCRILDETAAVLALLIEAVRLDFDRLRASG